MNGLGIQCYILLYVYYTTSKDVVELVEKQITHKGNYVQMKDDQLFDGVTRVTVSSYERYEVQPCRRCQGLRP